MAYPAGAVLAVPTVLHRRLAVVPRLAIPVLVPGLAVPPRFGVGLVAASLEIPTVGNRRLPDFGLVLAAAAVVAVAAVLEFAVV